MELIMKINKVLKQPVPLTAGGAVASRINKEQELRRTVASCMLWEDTFYESGVSIADRIKTLIPDCRPAFVAACAYEARTKMNLRHVPLLIVREMARLPNHRDLVAKLLPDVIQRVDEITEFVAIYWKDGKQPLSAQIKKGLAKAFLKFNEYQFAKYDLDGAVKLRDVLFLCHAKPATGVVGYNKDARKAGVEAPTDDGSVLFGKMVAGTLKTPDTWEVALSAGADKKETFERLMKDNKLGALAFLRNLRNMQESGVSRDLIEGYAATVNVDRVLPFRYVAAARVVPTYEGLLDDMLLRTCKSQEKLKGKTVVIVDTSGSMGGSKVSAKSDLSRLDAAGALAAILRDSCDDCRVYATAGNDSSRVHATIELPARRGMALVEKFTGALEMGNKDSLYHKIGGGGIFLKQCMDYVAEKEGGVADRIIVLTDEVDCDNKANPSNANAFGKTNYLINVSVAKNGIAYNKFTHINGWSEHVVDYIREIEKEV
jgi:60 kDa SS-A/Ro ribonucleoprotein